MNALCDSAKEYGPLIGRVLMSLIFLTSAYGKITGFDATLAAMTGKGMPVAQVLLVCAIAIELVCGTMLVLGWRTRRLVVGVEHPDEFAAAVAAERRAVEDAAREAAARDAVTD